MIDIVRVSTAIEDGTRLDQFLHQNNPDMSRSKLQKLIQHGLVSVNGNVPKVSARVNAGDKIRISIPADEPAELYPEEIPLNIVYEDTHVLVVDKPAGLTVHPAPGHPTHTLVNAVLTHCPDIRKVGSNLRPGIVHRLDKDTSGLMVVAKTNMSYRYLSYQMKARHVKKGYISMVRGRLHPPNGTIDQPIARHPRNRKKMAVVDGGRHAKTHYQVLDTIGGYTLVHVKTETGRTHQIRVHFSSIGHPLLGDSTYGQRSPILARHFLHANYLGFYLPPTNDWREYTADLPEDLRNVLLSMGQISAPLPNLTST